MKLLKESRRARPRVSLILLDWSVRESFHLLHYLGGQDVPRDEFEVVVIEYYSRVSGAVRKFEDQVDSWLLLEMPQDCYYHKHLMYNAGLVLARGEICVICDSDAMVKPGFIRAITGAFEREPGLVLHLDQFRNNRRDFYPFNYPDFEQVMGGGCVNNADGRPSGLADSTDPIHSRNYGACMCARRADLIAIGGADEHLDFVGHICGPYDMTFRLVNNGLKEIWHPSEFLYHTWHPGQAGTDNYLGPHDGRHVSTTSLATLGSRRIMPLLENPAVRALREQPETPAAASLARVVRAEGPGQWRRAKLEAGSVEPAYDEQNMHVGYHRGYSIYRESSRFYAHLAIEPHGDLELNQCNPARIEAPTLAAIRDRIDAATPLPTRAVIATAKAFVVVWQVAHYLKRKVFGRRSAGSRQAGAGVLTSGAGVRFGQRLAQFRTECNSIVEALANLVPNLQRIGESGTVASPQPVKVVLGDRRTEIYLRLLRTAGSIPPVSLERAESGNEAVRIVAEVASPGHPERVVIARALYYSCYPAMAALYRERAFAVV